MSDDIAQFKALREKLLAEKAELEESIDQMAKRLVELQDLFPDEVVVVYTPEVEVGTWLESRMPNDPVAVELYRFIRDNPGVGRAAITEKFRINRRVVKRKDLDNAISKLSRAGLIKNSGGNRTSSWYIMAGDNS